MMREPGCTCLTELEDDAYGPGGPMSGRPRPAPCPLHSMDPRALLARLRGRAAAVYDGVNSPSLPAQDATHDVEHVLCRVCTSTDPRDAGASTETPLGVAADGPAIRRLAAHMTALHAALDLAWREEWGKGHVDVLRQIRAELMSPLHPWDPRPLACAGDSVSYVVRTRPVLPDIDVSTVPGAAMHVRYDVPYMPQPNHVVAILDGRIPDPSLTASAFMLIVTDEGRLLFAVNARRGLEVPGGHIEPGETPLEAALRETPEETGATVSDVVPLGSQLLISHGVAPKGWKYPFPVARQAFFAGRLASTTTYVENDECLAPRIIGIDEVPEQIRPFAQAALSHFGFGE